MRRSRTLHDLGLSLQKIAATFILCAFAAGCAAVDLKTTNTSYAGGGSDGIGGTGIDVATDQDGIVGTGVTPSGDGIGGTGIIGTITGFGSIIVNSREIDFDNDTVVENDGRPSQLSSLRVGQVIQGIARAKNGRLLLQNLEIQHVVSGPISAINHDRSTLVVLGQMIRVNFSGDTLARDAFKTLVVGDFVSVSGIRTNDETIVASRVDQRRKNSRILVRGPVTWLFPDQLRIGGLQLNIEQDIRIDNAGVGDVQVLVSGRLIDGVFTPQVLTSEPPLPFPADVDEVSIEAYASLGSDTGRLSIGGIEISVEPSALANVKAGDRLIVTGRVEGPRMVTASSIDEVRTFITILQTRANMRPAAMRPPSENRPERLTAPPRPAGRPQIERPQIERPQIERPQIERPSIVGFPMV